jgi:hypothetical protein
VLSRKIFLFPCGRAYFPTTARASLPDAGHPSVRLCGSLRKNLAVGYRLPFIASETELTIPAPLRHKKKSDVMRTIEKIQRKQESTKTSPFSIGLILKIAGIVAGFCVWGGDFVWALLGLVFCWPLIKGIASCLVSLICLVGFFWFLFTHIF